MIKKIHTKINQPVIFFPNWSDTSFFYPLNNKADLKEEFGFGKEDKLALYSGAIGEKQGLESILFAAKELKNVSGLKFVICGNGPYKEKLEALSMEMQLDNLFFMPLQPLEKFNRFLNMADIHLVIQKVNAGDLVMPSKLTNILAAGGLAIVTANPGTSLFELIAEYKMGILSEAENQEVLNNSIKRALENDSLIIIKNARTYAEENLSVNKVMQRFLIDSSIK
jgi:colanic acid biosynthesis glycosyl transferase WcaI